MTHRERLVKELYRDNNLNGVNDKQCQYIADFIIEREKKLVEALVKLNLNPGKPVELSILNMNNILQAIMQTIRLSGQMGDRAINTKESK